MHAFKFILVFYFDNILMKHIDTTVFFNLEIVFSARRKKLPRLIRTVCANVGCTNNNKKL